MSTFMAWLESDPRVLLAFAALMFSIIAAGLLIFSWALDEWESGR